MEQLAGFLVETVLVSSALSSAYTFGCWQRRERWVIELVELLSRHPTWPFF